MKGSKEASLEGLHALVPQALADSALLKHLKAALSCSVYQSQRHHPTAILFVRAPRKVKNPEFVRRTERTVVIILDKDELEREGAERLLDEYVQLYHRIGAHLTVFFQRAEELISEREFTTQGARATRETLDEWGIRLLLSRVTVFETDNEKDSARMVGRIGACLVNGVSCTPLTGFEEAAERVEGADLWLNFLVNIPGVSRAKAELIHKQFPSLCSLMQKYSDPSLSESVKRLLLEDLSEGQKQRKLSQRIYHLFTCTDPTALFLG